MSTQEARVCAHIHNGPHDGETLMMPWARIEVPMFGWDGDRLVESLYRLNGLWGGQDEAHYQFVEQGEPAQEQRECDRRRYGNQA